MSSRIVGIVSAAALVAQCAAASEMIDGRMNDAWSHDIGAETWTELAPPGAAPPVLEFPSGIYDPFHDRMLVFGSPYQNPAVKTIWSYDCSTVLWSEVVPPAGSLACPRTSVNSVHLDAPNRRAILVSGSGRLYSFDLDTNSIAGIDGSDWPTAGPASMCAYAFDQSRQRLLAYGGMVGGTGGGVLENLWVCDTSTTPSGARWTQVPRGAVWPGPLWEVAATVDPARDRMILFGGRRNLIEGPRIIYSDLTFELNLATQEWTTVTAARAPVRRGYNGECWDSQRECVWIYGGIFHETTAYIATYGDLWSLAPSVPDWAEALPRGGAPLTRRYPMMAYDTLRDRIFLFGGQHILITDLQVTAGIKLPRNGASISGNRVLVMAELTSGTEAEVRDVRFQYRTSAFGADGVATDPGQWTDIPPTEPLTHPNPDTDAPYFVHWDVTAMGTVRVDIRAIATGKNDVADPVPVTSTVLIDPGSADSSNSTGADDPVATAHAAAGATLDMGTAARASNANVFLRVNGRDLTGDADVAVQCRGIAAGRRTEGGIGCDFDVVTTSTVPEQTIPLVLECAYPDADGDGIVDGTTIPESELRLCTVSGAAVTPVAGSFVNTLNNTVRAAVSAGGSFGVYRAPTTRVGEWQLYD